MVNDDAAHVYFVSVRAYACRQCRVSVTVLPVPLVLCASQLVFAEHIPQEGKAQFTSGKKCDNCLEMVPEAR